MPFRKKAKQIFPAMDVLRRTVRQPSSRVRLAATRDGPGLCPRFVMNRARSRLRDHGSHLFWIDGHKNGSDRQRQQSWSQSDFFGYAGTARHTRDGRSRPERGTSLRQHRHGQSGSAGLRRPAGGPRSRHWGRTHLQQPGAAERRQRRQLASRCVRPADPVERDCWVSFQCVDTDRP